MRLRNAIIFVIVLSVILFFIGMYTYGKTIVWLLPKGNIKYVAYRLTNFPQILIYCFVLAMLPVSAWVVWRKAVVDSSAKRFFTIVLILGAIIIFTAFRRFWIVYEMSRFPVSQEVHYPLSQVKLEFYMLLGLITGSILSFFLFRKQAS